MQFEPTYTHKRYFQELISLTAQFNFNQLVDFRTWSRTINDILKQSILDHIYSNNYSSVLECYSAGVPFGDHLIVIIKIDFKLPKPKNTFRRDWRKYSAMNCANSFSNIDFEIDRMHVQDYWNSFENLVVNVVDKLAPVVLFRNELGPRTKPPRIITAKINKRKLLSKQLK